MEGFLCYEFRGLFRGAYFWNFMVIPKFKIKDLSLVLCHHLKSLHTRLMCECFLLFLSKLLFLNSHESFSKSVMCLQAFQKLLQNVQQKKRGLHTTE